MKFKITMKDPDAAFEAIRDAVGLEIEKLKSTGIISLDEADELSESRQRKVSESISKWLKYGEYLTVEFDTESGTAVVIGGGK